MAPRCKECGSDQIRTFTADMGIHFPGLKNIDRPVVWVQPEVEVCSHCGAAQFAIPKDKLRMLDE